MGRGRKPVNDTPRVLEIKNKPELRKQFEDRVQSVTHYLTAKRDAELAFQEHVGSIADQFGLSKGYVTNYAKGKYKNNIREQMEKVEALAELAFNDDGTDIVRTGVVEIKDDDFNDSSEALAVAETETIVAEEATPAPTEEAKPKAKRGRKPKASKTAEEPPEPTPEVASDVTPEAEEEVQSEVTPPSEDEPF